MKFSPKNSKVTVTLEKLTNNPEGNFVIRVSDKGIGMSEQDQRNLFVKAFY